MTHRHYASWLSLRNTSRLTKTIVLRHVHHEYEWAALGILARLPWIERIEVLAVWLPEMWQKVADAFESHKRVRSDFMEVAALQIKVSNYVKERNLTVVTDDTTNFAFLYWWLVELLHLKVEWQFV